MEQNLIKILRMKIIKKNLTIYCVFIKENKVVKGILGKKYVH